MLENIYLIGTKERLSGNISTLIESKILTVIKYQIKTNIILTHLELLKEAKINKLPYIIISNENTSINLKVFDNTFSRILSYLKNNNNWEIFVGSPSFIAYGKNQDIGIKYPYPAILSYKFGDGNNFVIYNSKIYDNIIKKITSFNTNKSLDDILFGCYNFITSLPFITSNIASSINENYLKNSICEISSSKIIGKELFSQKVQVQIKNNYVSGRLVGGLGNQMFIIAAAFSLALKTNSLLCIEKKNFYPSSNRKINEYWDSYFNFLNLSIEYTGTDKNESELKEFSFREILKTSPRINLIGYFQDAGYFYNFRNNLRDFFAPSVEIIQYLKNKYDFLFRRSEEQHKRKKNVSVHVRRGDYLKFKHVHHNIPKIYYEKCYDLILKKYKDLEEICFIIFSDDITWCRENIHGDIFIENELDYCELILMSICDIQVIANSSFSWWGAYLSNNKNEEVYMPGKWMENREYPNGLIIEGWTKITY